MTKIEAMKPVVLRAALILALALAGGQAVGPETFRFRSADLVVQLTPDIPGGQLRLSLGPFGDLTWRTHQGPINVEARFLVGRSAADLPDPGDFRDLRFAFLLRKVPWLLLFGAAAGVLVAQGSRRRRVWGAGIGATTVAVVSVLAVGVSALTFNARALRDPRYEGPIADAPRVLQLLKEVQRDWAGVEKNINKAVAGLQRLHTQVVTAAPTPPQGETVRLLFISDIHNNPLGMLVAREIIDRFEVDGILNAGDFTDRGTPVEGELFARFGDLGLPHLIAAGNHEDGATMDRVRKIKNVTVLDERETDIAEIDGVRVLGAADPNAYSIDSNPFNEVAKREMPIRCEQLRARFDATRAHVVLVHDPQLGECAATFAEEQQLPLVFAWGHLHAPAYEVRGSVLSVSPGTSGAAGFKTDAVRPYGFTLLEFDETTKRPVSICQFLFDTPSEVRQTACHIVAPLDTAARRALNAKPATRP